VFTVLVSVNPAASASFRKTPLQLASSTAVELLQELDPDQTGYVSVEAFAAAYSGASTTDSSSPILQALDRSAIVTLLGLDMYEPDDILAIFEDCSSSGLSGEAILRKDDFCRACRLLVKLGPSGFGVKYASINTIGSVLFELLDVNGDEFVSPQELLAALCVLLPSAPASKVAAIFNAFDENADGM
jgi:hypothetical protein